MGVIFFRIYRGYATLIDFYFIFYRYTMPDGIFNESWIVQKIVITYLEWKNNLTFKPWFNIKLWFIFHQKSSTRIKYDNI